MHYIMIDYLNHNFISFIILNENEYNLKYFECENCKIIVCENDRCNITGDYYHSYQSPVNFDTIELLLTCEEQQIKNLLE